jgi:hypothetical protein
MIVSRWLFTLGFTCLSFAQGADAVKEKAKDTRDTVLVVPPEATQLIRSFGCSVSVGDAHQLGGRNVLITTPDDGAQIIQGVQRVYCHSNNEVHFYRKCPPGMKNRDGVPMYLNVYRLFKDRIVRLDSLKTGVFETTVLKW